MTGTTTMVLHTPGLRHIWQLPMQRAIRVGDYVRVVDVSEKDAYFNVRSRMIGRIGRVAGITSTTDAPWLGCEVSGPDMPGGYSVFFAVRLEVIE